MSNVTMSSIATTHRAAAVVAAAMPWSAAGRMTPFAGGIAAAYRAAVPTAARLGDVATAAAPRVGDAKRDAQGVRAWRPPV